MTAKATSQSKGRICDNRRARHDYAIEDTLEAGLELVGTEVKSLRAGKAHLNDAYVLVRRGEAWLFNAHIAEYSHGNRFNHEPMRTRRLLLKKSEIAQLHVATTQKGKMVVPLALYFKAGWAKVSLGIGTSRKRQDKRQVIRERSVQREMDRAMRRRR